jgi:hypothetical protein
MTGACWLKTWVYKLMFDTLSNSAIFSFWALCVCEKNAYALSGRIICNCPNKDIPKRFRTMLLVDYRAQWNRASSLMKNMTFGCLMPMIRPHSDRSSEISQPASSYWASWWILFGLGCTIIRFTRVLFLPPPSRRRAQWEGVNGALLSHILHVSARIPTTPLPSKVSLLWEWKCDEHNQPSCHVKKKQLRHWVLTAKRVTYFSCGRTHIGVQLSDHAVCKLLKTKQDTKNQNTPTTESWSKRLHHPIWSSPWATGSVRNNQKGLHQRLLPDKAKAVQ